MNADLESAFDSLFAVFDRYVSLSPDEWEDIRSRWKPRTFQQYQMLLQEGEIERHFYFIIKGVHIGHRTGADTTTPRLLGKRKTILLIRHFPFGIVFLILVFGSNVISFFRDSWDGRALSSFQRIEVQANLRRCFRVRLVWAWPEGHL